MLLGTGKVKFLNEFAKVGLGLQAARFKPINYRLAIRRVTVNGSVINYNNSESTEI